MRSRELVKLESDLLAGIESIDVGLRQRLREAMREFLMHDTRMLPGCSSVKERKDIMATIQTMAEAELLRRVIERPKEFSTKELKELWRGTLLVEPRAPDEKKDPLAFLEGLDIKDADKARMMEARLRLWLEESGLAGTGPGRPFGPYRRVARGNRRSPMRVATTRP
jgi:hypothetical protein